MADLLLSFGYSLLGVLCNAYLKAVLSKREEKFSFKTLIIENMPAFPFAIMGVIIFNTVFTITPEMTMFIYKIFGLNLTPDLSKPGASWMFGFLLYATLRNIFKSTK